MTTLIPKFDLQNGGSTPAGAINRPINEKLQESISVKDFGAVGDGVTNDYAAIAAAIASLPAEGGVLLFPSQSTYKINSTLALPTATKSFTIQAYGATLDFTGLANSTDAITTNGGVGAQDKSYFNWFGGTILGKGVTSGNGFYIQNGNNAILQVGVTIRDIIVYGFGGGAGIKLFGAFGTLLENCHIEYSGTVSTGGIWVTGEALGCDRTQILNSVINNSYGNGVFIDRGVGIYISECRLIGNAGFGVLIDPISNQGGVQNVVIEKNYIEVNTAGGVSVQGGTSTQFLWNLSIVRNTILGGQNLVLNNAGATHRNFEVSQNFISNASTNIGSNVLGVVALNNTLSGTSTVVSDASSSIQLLRVDGQNTGMQFNSGTTFTDASYASDSLKAGNSTWYHFYGSSANATVINVWIDGAGDVNNLNGVYGTISDAKLKENIVDATPKLNDLLQLKVRNFNFKPVLDEDGLVVNNPEKKQIGFIAQEVEAIFPGLIDETPSETGTTKSIKTSVLVPMLVKAIQELKAEIDLIKATLDEPAV